MQLKSHLISMAAVGALAFGTAAYASPFITLDPVSTNNGQGAISAADSQFNTDNLHARLTSVLDITAASGGSTWFESGVLYFDKALLGGVVQNSGINREFGGGNWDLYGAFLGQGNGSWILPGTFLVSTINSFTIDLFAMPASAGNVLSVATPSSGSDVTHGLSGTGGAKLLGTATFQAFAGLTSATLFDATRATTSLQGFFDFTPVADYAGNFFAYPVPFNINIGGSGSSTTGESAWATNGDGVRITTSAQTPGTGNVTFDYKIPEPGALSLTGLALFGLGFVARRKKRQEAVA